MRKERVIEAASGAVVEALEGRRLMTAAAPVGSEIVSEDGAVLGSAWLDDAGIVHVVAGDGDDEVWVGHWGENNVFVAINSVRKNFAESDVRGFEVDCGAGDDNFSFWSSDDVVKAPVTVHGGAGNDVLSGQDWLNNVDGVLAERSAGPFASITIYGDEGDDVLGSGLGDVELHGGAGTDTFYDSTWGKTKIVDDVAGGTGELVVERPARGDFVTYSIWNMGAFQWVPMSNRAKEWVWEDMMWTVKQEEAPAPEPQPEQTPEPVPTSSGDAGEASAEVVVAVRPNGEMVAGSPWSVAEVLWGGEREFVWE